MKTFRLMLALATMLLSAPAFADDFADAVRALNADNFSDKVAAAETLAALGDDRAAIILEALADGRLYATPDGAILVERNGGYADSITQAAASGTDASAITVNNRMRGAVGRLACSAPMPSCASAPPNQ